MSISRHEPRKPFIRRPVLLLIYLAIFLLFFLQYPLRFSLTGDIDTIYNLALFRQIQLYLEMLFTGVSNGGICYPTEAGFWGQSWLYFGANFGIGFVHVLLVWAGIPDLWAHWLFMSMLFTANAFTLWMLLDRLTGRHWLAAVAALFFPFAHFMLANLDNINTIVFFPSFLSLYYYVRYTQEQKLRPLAVSVVWGALQIYLSPYNFVIHGVLLSVWALGEIVVRRAARNTLRDHVAAVIAYTILIFPYLYVYFLSDMTTRALPEHVTRNFIHIQSLNLDDVFRVLKHHLYRTSEPVPDQPLLTRIRSAYLGISFYLLALIGLRLRKMRRLAVTFVIVGWILATGPFFSIGNMRQGPALMYPIYEFFDLYDTISVPIRLYFISLFGMTLLALNGLTVIWQTWRKRWAVAAVVLLVLAENVPVPMEAFDHRYVLQVDPEMKDLLSGERGQVVLDLPCTLVEANWNYRREYIYMYQQYAYRQQVMNCFPPFLPPDRKRLNDLLGDFSSREIATAVQEYGINWLVFHEQLVVLPGEKAQLDTLRSLPFLQEADTRGDIRIFKVKPEL